MFAEKFSNREAERIRPRPRIQRLPATHLKLIELIERARSNRGNTVLKEHMIRHPEKIRCEFCERSFSRRHHLLRHLQLIHCRMALCVHCRKLYANRSQLNKHVRRMHSVSGQEKTVTLRDFTINISPLRISSSFNTQ